MPLWVAQRLWMGCLLFAAGAGALYLCRIIGLTGPGRYVAAIGFMFTPYVLQYAGRISVILLPWAGLPWMVAFVILALRRGGWRYPALFALVVALVSGINASSILYVGIAPALWLPYAVVVAREATWRKAWGVAWKVGLLSALVSLWWAVGLQVEAAYGVNVLKYTETVPATSGRLPGLGDPPGTGLLVLLRVGPGGAVDPDGGGLHPEHLAHRGQLRRARPVLRRRRLLPVAAPRLLRAASPWWAWCWPSGPTPTPIPSGVGSLIKSFLVDTTAGLALRSTDRASPLVILGLAMFLGRRGERRGRPGAPDRAGRRRASPWPPSPAATVPLWTGGIIANGFTQPATPPAYVRQAAAALDAHPSRAPGSTPCPATTSPPTGGATPSTPSTPGS